MVELPLEVLDLVALVVDLLLQLGAFLEHVFRYGQRLLEILSLEWIAVIYVTQAFLELLLDLTAVYDDGGLIDVLHGLVRILLLLFNGRQVALAFLALPNIGNNVRVVVVVDGDVPIGGVEGVFNYGFTEDLGFLPG